MENLGRNKSKIVSYSPYILLLGSMLFVLMLLRNWNLRSQFVQIHERKNDLEDKLIKLEDEVDRLKTIVDTKNHGIELCKQEKVNIEEKFRDKDRTILRLGDQIAGLKEKCNKETGRKEEELKNEAPGEVPDKNNVQQEAIENTSNGKMAEDQREPDMDQDPDPSEE